MQAGAIQRGKAGKAPSLVVGGGNRQSANPLQRGGAVAGRQQGVDQVAGGGAGLPRIVGAEALHRLLQQFERGLRLARPVYAAQIALYQAYMDLPAPALFTALNRDTM